MLIFIGVCFFLIAWAGFSMYKGLIAYSWPSCDGKILVSEVHRSDRARIKDRAYYPYIRYQYQVKDSQYISEKISFVAKGSGFGDVIQKKIDQYPVGTKVRVYYNPKNIKESVLERGLKGVHILLLIVGFIFLGVGIIGYKYWNILNAEPEVVRRSELNNKTSSM